MLCSAKEMMRDTLIQIDRYYGYVIGLCRGIIAREIYFEHFVVFFTY